ncbi:MULTISPECIES: hypothetical protein [unclassified Clostridium]|uniref:hypothetical protein n=1 Tax=unclassified Clostridium TaxID=2614128 RepID=UPI002079A348|nr:MULTISPECIES: hypothetical protein [unclassified Clostridium]
MGKYRKAKLIERVDGKKLYMVASVNDESVIVTDARSKKPVGSVQGEDVIYFQEINRIEFERKNKEKENIMSFYAPNNVGILLTIANKALVEAQRIYNEEIDPDKINHTDIVNGGKENELKEKTVIVYEFIEAIQTSIVFGYTAIEAFTNLSINDDYKYENSIDSKGIIEIYDKKAIERWLSLDVKISNILADIYKCRTIKNEKIWNKFKLFEDCRNQIIHQKSIDVNNFYEKYFNKEIFELCSVPEKIIKYFFEKDKDSHIANELWPLVENADNEIPIYTKTKKELMEFVRKTNE